MNKGKSSFNTEKVLRGRESAEILCVCSGALKNR